MKTQQKALNHSKKKSAARSQAYLGCILSLTCGLALAIGILTAPQTARADNNKHHMVYEVYAGGIHAVQAKMMINFGADGRYDIEIDAATRGLLGRLAPWSGTFETHGWVEKDGRYQPQLHKSTSTWQDELEIKEYKYKRDGGFEGLVVTDHGKEPRTKEADDALTQGTVDAFTAAMQVMKAVGAGEKCAGTAEVFDGKRRFEQVFAEQGIETLTANKYNIYSGEAAMCTLEVKPVSGAWHKKPRGWFSIQEQGRERGTIPTVWLSKTTDTTPAIPLKVRVKTAYGTLFMHLAEYRNGEEILIAKKRFLD